jgi:uncharacterized protein involved in exopolysaccharide biosynthesis
MKYPSSSSKPPVRRKRGIVVRDVLFVFCTLLCLGGAAAMIYKATLSPSYETQAKLLVRYVLERSAVDPYESMVDASGACGINVMDAEIEIIKSADLALEVAAKVGPEKILTKSEIPRTKADAAVQLAKDLDVQTTHGSSVIHLAYRHSDPKVAVAVLKQLIDTYFEKHLEIHRSTGAFESVARQTDQARSRLGQTEVELSKLSAESGFLSLADAKTALEGRRNALRSSLMATQVELAEQRVKVASLGATLGVEPLAPPKADDIAADEAKPVQETPSERIEQVKPPDQKQGLAGQAKDQLAEGESPQTPGADLNVERTRLASLEARLKAFAEQAERVDADMERISNHGLEFTMLERRRQREEEKYRNFETNLEKARVDETLNPASMPNICVVQSPSHPVRSLDGTSKMVATGLAACGLLLLLRIALRMRRPRST